MDKQIIIDGVDIFNTLDEWADLISQEWCSGEYPTAKIIKNYILDINKQLARKTQECEELKKRLMQNDEVNTFFNTPIEGWSNDPCGICPHKAENEELKKEIIDKNEKIKELRFSVSDLTNRLCYLNAEKSFRIVDLEQALDEIKSICLKDVHTFADGTQLRYDSLDEILNIINKAKGGGECQ